MRANSPSLQRNSWQSVSYGHPSDIAGVVGYLAGRDTGYITGANWNVDGGFTV